MGDDDSETISEKDKIQILLQEYNTLRSELVANTGKAMQMAALLGVFLTLILTRPIDKRFWIAASVGVIGLIVLGSVIVRDIRRLARRVIELETDINQRAGEKLLVWESERGGVTSGLLTYFGLSKRKEQK